MNLDDDDDQVGAGESKLSDSMTPDQIQSSSIKKLNGFVEYVTVYHFGLRIF